MVAGRDAAGRFSLIHSRMHAAIFAVLQIQTKQVMPPDPSTDVSAACGNRFCDVTDALVAAFGVRLRRFTGTNTPAPPGCDIVPVIRGWARLKFREHHWGGGEHVRCDICLFLFSSRNFCPVFRCVADIEQRGECQYLSGECSDETIGRCAGPVD